MQNCIKQYIEFIAGKRMHAPKLDPTFNTGTNPYLGHKSG